MPSKKEPKRARSPLLLVFLTVFIDLLGFGIIIPLLPVYGQEYGASGLMLGLLLASFSGMQFFFAPFWGRLSDRIGRRPVLVGGLLGTAISYTIFGFADSLEILLVSRILAGFFGANVSTAQAYMADVTPPEERSRAMGLIGAAFGLGFTFGPLLGGELSPIHEGLPGFVAAGLSLTAALFGFFNLPEPERQRDTSRVFGAAQVRGAFADGRIGRVMGLYFLAIFSFAAFESWFIPYATNVFPSVFNLPEDLEGASREQYMQAARIAGRYLCFIGLLGAVIQGGLIRRLVARYTEMSLIVAGPLILAFALFLVGVAPAWWVVILGCAITPAGFGINNPSLNGLLSRASPVQEQGAYLGLNQSLASLARMTAPVICGGLAEISGHRVPFFMGAGVLVIAAFFATSYRARFAETFSSETTPSAPATET